MLSSKEKKSLPKEADGETQSLYTAVERGDEAAVSAILQFPEGKRYLDEPGSPNAWTPLFAACSKGHLSMVRTLLDKGARIKGCDASGWTAREIACFWGHMPVAEFLLSHKGVGDLSQIPMHHIVRPKDRIESISPSAGESDSPAGALQPKYVFTNSVTQAGGNDQVLVSLGCSNTRSTQKSITFLPETFLESIAPSEDRVFVVVRAKGAYPSLGHYRQLTSQETSIYRPMHFTPSENVDDLLLEFEIIVSPLSGIKGIKSLTNIGKGVALLRELRRGLSVNRESLDRDHTIPIFKSSTETCIGTLAFNILVVNSFKREDGDPRTQYYWRRSPGFWKADGGHPVKVVGHRGLGANSAARTNLQILENTMQSFLTAAHLGASCVKFDVQLTKDHRTVLFHDFHTLSFDQFNILSKLQSAQYDDLKRKLHNGFNDDIVERAPEHRSHSLNENDEHRINDNVQRMQLTQKGKVGSIEGNIRGFSTQEPATSLEQLLTDLPENLPVNIEIKYPMLWEAEDRGMDPFACEINLFVDTILKVIYANWAQRSITLSSFNPEICVLLACKQKSFPILFISKAGSVPAGDIRASSLKEAIEFASAWLLKGIVMLSDPFVMCPRLLTYAKDSGLVVCSYGNLNDIPHCAKVSASSRSYFQSSTAKPRL